MATSGGSHHMEECNQTQSCVSKTGCSWSRKTTQLRLLFLSILRLPTPARPKKSIYTAWKT